MKTLIAGLAALVISAPVFAVTALQSQEITQINQSFTMGFSGLPANTGSFGSFTLQASGDFSDDFGTLEGLTVSFDGLGSFFVNESGVTNNTVSGLSLMSFSSSNVLNEYDENLTASFSLTSALLNAMLSDNAATFRIQSGPLTDAYYAQAYPGTDPDFVSVNLSYNLPPTPLNPIPEPTKHAMLLAGLGVLGLIIRRRS